MPASVRIPIEEASQSGEARRLAQRMACDVGLDDVRAGQVAIVVTEASTNILRHARTGEVLLQVADSAGNRRDPELEVLSLDKGPGMQDIDRCLRDGFTTANSAGQGLGAIRRLAAHADFYSAPGSGTAILASWPLVVARAGSGPTEASGSSLLVGAVNVSKYGEEVCGDAWGIEQSDSVSTVLVADGLGHGFEASLASLEAVKVLRRNPDAAPGRMIELIHCGLRSFRGAAVSIARIDRAAGKLTYSGLGNVAGQIYSRSARGQHLVSVNGTAGHAAARIREFEYDWPADGILIVHSDGLSTSTTLDQREALASHDPTLIAGVLYRDFSRGHDDATVVVAKAA